MKARNPLKAVGSSFDGWLAEQKDFFKADVIAGAMKRQFVMELRAMMKAHGLGVNGLQKLLRTGPSQVQRLLDPEDVGISLSQPDCRIEAGEGARHVGLASASPKTIFASFLNEHTWQLGTFPRPTR